ncbi:hypothetical protein HYP71_gp083 [Arthrobacter phage KBurrousTX]|uniref:Uncharacterized protein n=1 Tax=Arthrobacter phage KBurrousTX TaxID=2315608 RepID=A0A386K958_9CAUD|nr:hypothetical protein HYP71_gp083 [Arthrobacter phage KBurrousTX]AYD81577.1 hypothetical protein KBurrousTX_83 [Arthrobacter phage KBurrousTX]
MALSETYTDGAAAPEWVKEGGTVAVCQRTHYGVSHSVNKGYVERLTKTQVILNDGRRFSLKNGLRQVGDSKRDPYGPGPLFLADWDSTAVKEALREQFLRNTADQIGAKARAFASEPDGKKAVELIDLLSRWAKRDGMEVPNELAAELKEARAKLNPDPDMVDAMAADLAEAFNFPSKRYARQEVRFVLALARGEDPNGSDVRIL